MKFARATLTTCDHHDRTAPAAGAGTSCDEALEANGMPTFGLLHARRLDPPPSMG